MEYSTAGRVAMPDAETFSLLLSDVHTSPAARWPVGKAKWAFNLRSD